MNSLKYYAVSFGVLMALTGSVIVLADEVENEPVVLEDKEEVSYVFEDTVETVMEEPEIITSEENVEIVAKEEPIADEVSNPIVVEEAPAETPASGPVLKSPSGVWGSDENGTYYEVSGQKLKDTVTDIDGSYYGFNPLGYLYQSTDFYLNPYYYRAKDDGKLYVNEWYETGAGGYYYYGAEGKGAEGVTNVDGTDYYFEGGFQFRNSAFEYNGDPYYTDDDGQLVAMSTGWNHYTRGNGIVDTYLVVDGTYVRDTVKYFEANYYYFESDGRLAKDCSNIIYYGDEYYSVRSKKDGKLYVYEWFYARESADKYYYGISGLSSKGFRRVDGHDYYFGQFGRLYSDRAEIIDGQVYIFEENGLYTLAGEGWNSNQSNRFYVKNGELVTNQAIEIDGEEYYFRHDGKLLVNDVATGGNYSDPNETRYYYGADYEGHLVKNAFFMGYYFLDDGKTLPNGFYTIDGYQYCMEDGKYITNTIRNIDGTNYIFDITGAASIAKEGITTNIRTYYVLNGELADGIHEIDGKEYYFLDGIMQTDRIIMISATEGIVTRKDGTIVKGGWYGLPPTAGPEGIGAHVYADSEGKLLTGLQTINGKTFILGLDVYNPFLLNRSTLLKYDGQWYYLNSTGVATAQDLNDGWVSRGADIYYLRNDELVINELIEIEGEQYAIDSNGKLVRNGFWYSYTPEYHIYRTDASGKIIKDAWVQVNDGTKLDGEYYFDADGKGLDAWATVNGHKYYFDNGRKLAAEIREINGKLYKFSDEGSQYTNDVADGEYTEGRSFQVVRNGILVENELYAYQNTYYLLNGVGDSLWYEGIVCLDYEFDRITPQYTYVKNDGIVARMDRIETDDGFVYFAADDGILKDGLLNMLGNQYAVVWDTYRYSGYGTYDAKNVPVVIKGVHYYADSYGVLHRVLLNSLHSLSLEDNIGVNFYYSFDDVVLEDQGAKVVFNVDGVKTEFLVRDSSSHAMGGYIYRIFTEEVTSVQLASKITAKVILSNGDLAFEKSYSAKDYCDQVIASSMPEAGLKSLMKALLNYGGYAQLAFNYNTDNLANKDLINTDVSDVTAATLQPYGMTTSGSAAGLNYQGSTLALNSATAINHIFTVSSGHNISEYVFKLGDEILTPIKRGNKYYIVIPDIYSKDLDTPYTVTVGSYNITYSALSYAYKALISDAASPELKNMARALYKYNQEANEFFGA